LASVSSARRRPPRHLTAVPRARQYLDGHPDANQAAIAASNQPHPQAAATLRDYFRTHPQEYSDLRGILTPVDDTERQCHVTALPPNLESAFHQFMAG
jgi:hemophore-related protein